MSLAATSPQTVTHNDLANALRALAMDGVEQAKSGHPGMPMGMADVATVLWQQFLRFDATAPHWPNRDRFILSAGHGSMLLYALAYLTGYKAMPLDELKKFRQLGSKTAGHPEHDVAAGIETTTGPLGQGLGNAVGMALAEQMLAARFGEKLVQHHTYVIASDGDLMEGISHEAASLAGHWQLGRLIVLYDDNQISIDGPTALSFSEDIPARFAAYGWHTQRIDGHNPAEISAAIKAALADKRPSLIACRTIIGFGAPNKQGSKDCHGSPLGADEIAKARAQLNWPHAPFVVPAPIKSAWESFGVQHQSARLEWEKNLNAAAPELKELWHSMHSHELSPAASSALHALKQKYASEKPSLATRQTSGEVLAALVPVMPHLVGGSADLTPSNNTQVKGKAVIKRGDFSGQYIHWGVREHGMASAMNGMALHGGLIPYSGTFLSFADYCRPSIRLAALMHQRVIYVMTHDSIGLGEDGPTHQPVEHLASLRAIPNLYVFRPADGIETAECWEAALSNAHAPSLLALTRQALPTLRADTSAENRSKMGAYVLAEAKQARAATLIASGSEVSLAMSAREKLAALGIDVAVVSMPCWTLFAKQSPAYQAQVLGSAKRIGIEAATGFGWERWLAGNNIDGSFIGMHGFGASAPYQELYQHFGITVEAIMAAVQKS